MNYVKNEIFVYELPSFQSVNEHKVKTIYISYISANSSIKPLYTNFYTVYLSHKKKINNYNSVCRISSFSSTLSPPPHAELLRQSAEGLTTP